jgi:hypothetical protein
MTGAELVGAMKTVRSLSQFMGGGGLAEAVATIVGDVHMDAAKLALSMSSTSNSPEDRIKSAISHFEVAQVAYDRVQAKSETLLGSAFNILDIILAGYKSVWVNCLMAMCYYHLGDKQAALRVIGMAESALDRAVANDNRLMDSNLLGQAVGGFVASFTVLFRPSSWKTGRQGKHLRDKINRAQILEIKGMLSASKH